MKLLAFDTSTLACSVAVECDGELYQEHEIMPRRHAQALLPMIDALLKKAGLTLKQLDAIAFGQGPGSFTGVRIAAAMVQGLAFATGLPVIAVSSLQAAAQTAYRRYQAEQVVVAQDARQQEVYWGQYRLGAHGMELVGEEQLMAPANCLVDFTDKWLAAGTAWSAYADILSAVRGENPQNDSLLPEASDLLILAREKLQKGDMIAPDFAIPQYLRNKVTD